VFHERFRQSICPFALGSTIGAPPATETLDVDDALVKALRDNVKREVAPYKDPRAIEFVEQSPKTESGKSKRFSLR
jgi:acyl-coenzyme A synthetase/AMP-(fatty) acid ligase